ncbi:hypothetical protein DSECCO2_560360 [anaerobic digester metagenome]
MYIDVGPCVCAAFVTQQQTVALSEITGVDGFFHHLHKPPVTVLAAACRDSLRNDGALCVFPEMYHFASGIGLLKIIGHSNGIKFPDAVIAQQYAARIFPGNRRAGLHLCPRDFAVGAFAQTALGDKVVDAALSFLVAGIPVLNRAVFHFGVVHGNDFHNGCVQLVFIAHGSGAALEITHIGTFISYNERAFELSGLACIDAEIGG